MTEKKSEKLIFVGEPARPTREQAEALRQWSETGKIPLSYVDSVTKASARIAPDASVPEWIVTAANKGPAR